MGGLHFDSNFGDTKGHRVKHSPRKESTHVMVAFAPAVMNALFALLQDALPRGILVHPFWVCPFAAWNNLEACLARDRRVHQANKLRIPGLVVEENVRIMEPAIEAVLH